MSAQAVPTLRLVVLLSGGGRTLVNLQACIDRGELPARIELVISSRRDAGGLERARERGLPTEVLRPRDFPSGESFAAAQAGRIAEVAPHLVIMAGYLVHFPVPAALEGRMLNIHPSLLPRHGGQGCYGDHVHRAVLEAGDTQTGCTVHVVDNEYDHGPIVAATEVDVLPGDDVSTLAARVFEAECATYPPAILRHARALGLLAETQGA